MKTKENKMTGTTIELDWGDTKPEQTDKDFIQYVEFVVFSNNPAKWKIETLQKCVMRRKGIK